MGGCRVRADGDCDQSGGRPAFSLIELLVVIGILVVLVALLLPSLMAARRSAQSVRCLANLGRIAQGGAAHAAEHDGYYPLAGHVLRPDGRPTTLDDSEEVRYTYYRPPNGPAFPASFHAAIAASSSTPAGLPTS
jgi:prepilin-type N-terminal cleavage/methylation domain-containing protein